MTRRLVEQEARARVGELVGDRYELARLIGCGGCGAVYEARHRNTRGRIAVKLLLAVGGDEGARRRFEREARILTQLSHPHIVRVFDLGAHGDALYLAEELIEGETLRERLSSRGALSPTEAREIVVPLLDALAYAHAKGVVHRDVKPENVLLSRTESGALRPVLIDFGIARVDDPDEARTRTGTLIGTPAYMAPEQCLSAAKVDARADLWAVAAVLFECLAARPPFEGTPTETLAALLTLPAPLLRSVCPDAPPALDALIAAALSRAPDDRPASATVFANELRACGELSATPLTRVASVTNRDTVRETLASVVAPPRAQPVAPRRARIALIASLAALVAVVFVSVRWTPRAAPTSSPRREVERSSPPPVTAPVSVANVAVIAPLAHAEATPSVVVPVVARPRARVAVRAPSRVVAPTSTASPTPSPPSRGANHALILEP